MRTLLENLREDERADTLRGVKCAGRYVVNDIGQAIAEIERLQEVKRAALAVADDRVRENAALQIEINTLRSAVYKIQSPDNLGKYPHFLDEPEKAAIRRAVASGLS